MAEQSVLSVCTCAAHGCLSHFPYVSCISGHSGHFRILAIASITNIGMHISFHISVFTFFEKISEMELVDCVANSFLTFEECSVLLSRWLARPAQFRSPQWFTKGSYFSTSCHSNSKVLQKEHCSFTFDSSHSGRYEVIPHCEWGAGNAMLLYVCRS